MAIRGQWGVGQEHPCSYLSTQTARLELLRISAIDAAEFEALVAQGYRHFGTLFFRPWCRACHACVPIRIRTAEFRARRSVRRVLERARDLDVAVTTPRPTAAAYGLYCQHKERFRDTNPDADAVSYDEFVESFFHAFPFSRTLEIRERGRLLAVSHFDLTAQVLSAIYCYYDPRDLPRSPGRLAVYLQIALAAQHGIPFVHLGYYIAANPHMRYKAGFQPNEVLLGDGEWVPFMDGRNRCRLDPERLLQGFCPPGKPQLRSAPPSS